MTCSMLSALAMQLIVIADCNLQQQPTCINDIKGDVCSADPRLKIFDQTFNH